VSHHPKGPPPEERTRRRDLARPQPANRDMTPAVGRRGQAGGWRRAVEGARVAMAKPNWGDARWSYLYGRGDTRYAVHEEPNGSVQAAARAARGGEQITVPVRGPMLNPPVWTWQVPLYFWFGGIAAGSSFIAVACDAAGDERSARIARRVTLGAIGPGSPLLILDLGRPERFLNMLRIFKPRSAMSMGSWCLSAFSSTAGASVAADLLGRRRLARAAGVPTALLGTYLGSYSAILLCATAVPLWARSRAFLPPIFISTALATASAANRLVLTLTGMPAEHPTRRALRDLETLAMTAELVLSEVNERRLGDLAEALDDGQPGRLFRFARGAVLAGLATRLWRGRGGEEARHAASVLFLLAGLAYRFAWVEAGKRNAADDEVVARMARTKSRPLGREPVAPPAPSVDP
jgi:formate-dependent nitrite reductase membrane component NrfD